MSRWMNWLHIKNLVDVLADNGLQDPAFRKMRNMFKWAPRAVLVDGRPINLKDPAVTLFFNMIDFHYSQDPDANLADAVGKLKTWFLVNLRKPGMGRYESNDLANLMELRLAPNGWDELDRVIKQIAEEPLSAKVARTEAKVFLNLLDPGLDGTIAFTLYLTKGPWWEQVNSEVAIASSVTEILALVEPALQDLGETISRYGIDSVTDDRNTLSLSLSRGLGSDAVFSIPLKPAIVVEPSDDGELQAHEEWSDPQPDWSKITWHEHDRAIFKELVTLLPRPEANRVKGSFLCDELGM